MSTLARPGPLVLDRKQIALIRAFDSIKRSQPALWSAFGAGLREYLEPEMRHMIRCPPELLNIAQGRAQIADDLLRLLDDCTALAEKWRAHEGQAGKQHHIPFTEPPKFE